MSKLIDTNHGERTKQARDEGFRAGEVYATKAQELCAPEEWTEARKAEWVDMLTWLAQNPYEEGQQPYTDAPEYQNEFYARQWKLSFDQGIHKTEAAIRRATQ